MGSDDLGRRQELRQRMLRGLELADRILQTRRLSPTHLPPETRKAYLFIRHAAGIMPGDSQPQGQAIPTPQGQYHALGNYWNAVNSMYFQGLMHPKTVRWSKRLSFQRLGFWDPQRDHVVISLSLDHPQVPPALIQYILYHEGLHKHLGLEHREGGRRFHTPTFRRLERLFPDWKAHETWLRETWPRLVKESLR